MIDYQTYTLHWEFNELKWCLEAECITGGRYRINQARYPDGDKPVYVIAESSQRTLGPIHPPYTFQLLDEAKAWCQKHELRIVESHSAPERVSQ